MRLFWKLHFHTMQESLYAAFWPATNALKLSKFLQIKQIYQKLIKFGNLKIFTLEHLMADERFWAKASAREDAKHSTRKRYIKDILSWNAKVRIEHGVPDTLRKLIFSKNDVQRTYFHVKLIAIYARNFKDFQIWRKMWTWICWKFWIML